MTNKFVKKLFTNTAYVRTGGSEQESKCANFLAETLKGFNLSPTIESFEVPMANLKSAKLEIDGTEIVCKGYLNCGSADITAPLYYLTGDDKLSLSKCKDKIVIFDGYLRYWQYRDMLDNGALGFISYDGNVHYADRDIDQRELRSYFVEDKKIPGVNINAKDAVKIIEKGAKTARIVIDQEEYSGNSHNVILDLPGKREEVIVFTAHYDTTSLSHGAYDNMSGSVGLIHLATHFAKNPHDYSLRFIWCGSEERGLLGSKAYCQAHEAELEKIVFNINLDMIGCTMGKFIACCTSEQALVNYVNYFGLEVGFQVKAYQDVYSSDSTPFADKGVPAISFARIAPKETATIHNSYDKANLININQIQNDMKFITAFTTRMANAVHLPVAKEIPDNIKEKLDEYLLRKRKK